MGWTPCEEKQLPDEYGNVYHCPTPWITCEQCEWEYNHSDEIDEEYENEDEYESYDFTNPYEFAIYLTYKEISTESHSSPCKDCGGEDCICCEYYHGR